MARYMIHTRRVLCAATILTACCCHCGAQADSTHVAPYKGYTGTVHQFGFIGGFYNTNNPNYSETDDRRAFRDWGVGIAYTLHDYVTRQFTFDVISSITMITAKYLETPGHDDNKKKIIWPVDLRFALGPSEDFQAYASIGLQWGIMEKNTGTYSLRTGMADNKTIHQMSGNAAFGLSILGPQKYMVHINLGAKFHFPIADNDNSETESNLADISKDRGCIVLNGGITVDLDRRKFACLMLNYEYPLGTPSQTYGSKQRFFHNTQTIAIGVIFHVGGTR